MFNVTISLCNIKVPEKKKITQVTRTTKQEEPKDKKILIF